jgi:DMSO/TMAO reductase YedYZ molybdopterin-dependent catalytic subunit
METPRLPAGQKWIERPLVYDVAHVAPLGYPEYRLRLFGAVTAEIVLSSDELSTMPCAKIQRDFHCVTSWSVQDIVWEGVLTRDLLARIQIDPGVRWALAHGRDGYSTSLPMEAFAQPDSLLAFRMNGEAVPLAHGGPVRLVVPSLYAWKSAKYVEGIEFCVELRRGYWEARGYHDRGDPWREERFRT